MNKTVQYEFAEVLQAGECFKISLVLDEYGKQVASKALIDSSDESACSRLNTQAEFLKSSSHPAIVNFRDNLDNELFMEAMAGNIQTLATKSKKLFSAGETFSFLRQMLTLLSHLDSRGLTAGQFSPRTILANEDLTIFKISAACKKDSPISSDPTETIFPPEINSPVDYDVHASDIYCLGMTCVELALGRAGFESLFKGMYDNSSDLWIRWHENHHETLPKLAEVLDGFPIGLTDILQKMIEKPLHLRFTSAQEVLSELNKLGIVDAAVTVKQKTGSRTITKLACGIAMALAGSMAWVALSEKEEAPVQQPTPVVVQAKIPTSYQVMVNSNKDFAYTIRRGDQKLSKSGKENHRSIQLQQGDKLIIERPREHRIGWSVSINDQERSFNGEEVVLSGLERNESIDLIFSRTIVMNSSYSNFVWKRAKASLEEKYFSDSSTFQIDQFTNQSDYVWIKTLDPTVKLVNSESVSGGWFKHKIRSFTNQVELRFEQTIEAELVGHGSLSHKTLKELSVKVGGHSLSLLENRFKGNVPLTQDEQPAWEAIVEFNGEELFHGNWNSIASASNTRKTIQLEGAVNFDLPSGFVLHKVNDKATSQTNDTKISVPLGDQLDLFITDSSGVIQIREAVDWTSQIERKADEYLRSKKLRNQGNQATYWLMRTGDRTVRKKIGKTNETAQLPVKSLSDYVVVVQWAPNLKREFGLEEFLDTRKSIEYYPAAAGRTIPLNFASHGRPNAVK